MQRCAYKLLDEFYRTQPSQTIGKVYPDGWVAHVLKSSWNYSLTKQQKANIFKNELGFTDGYHFDSAQQPNAIVVDQNYSSQS